MTKETISSETHVVIDRIKAGCRYRSLEEYSLAQAASGDLLPYSTIEPSVRLTYEDNQAHIQTQNDHSNAHH